MRRPWIVGDAALAGAAVLLMLAATVGAQPPDSSTTAAPVVQPPASAGPALSLLNGGTLDLRWTTPADRPLATPPGFDAQSAYGVTRDGMLMAWDLDSGRARWQVSATTAQPVVVGGTLAFVVETHAVRAVDTATGASVWTRVLPDVVAAPPYWDHGWLIVSFAGGDLAALRAADGEVVWRSALGSVVLVAPATAFDYLYVGLADGRTVALTLASGHTVWSRTLGGVATGVTALDDQLLVGTASGTLDSLGLRDGRPRWRWRTGAAVVASAAADQKRIYVTAYDHILRALDRRSGNLRWRRALPHRPAGAPVIVGDLVVVPSLSTELAAYQAATGVPALAVASTTEVAGGAHVRLGGPATGTRLFALSVEGQLLAFALRVEPAPAPLDVLPGTAVPEAAAQSPPPPPPPPESR